MIGRNRYQDLLNLLRTNPSLHSFPVTIIANILQPFWEDLIKYPKLFNRFFNLFMIFNVLGLSKYLLRFSLYSTKIFLGGVFSALGILWSESLQSIFILKEYAIFVKDQLDYYLDIKVPTIKTGENIPDEINSNYIYYTGIVLLGVAGLVVLLSLCEAKYPGTVSSIPYVGDLVKTINNSCSSVYNTITNSYDYIRNLFPNNASGDSTGGATSNGQSSPTDGSNPHVNSDGSKVNAEASSSIKGKSKETFDRLNKLFTRNMEDNDPYDGDIFDPEQRPLSRLSDEDAETIRGGFSPKAESVKVLEFE